MGRSFASSRALPTSYLLLPRALSRHVFACRPPPHPNICVFSSFPFLSYKLILCVHPSPAADSFLFSLLL